MPDGIPLCGTVTKLNSSSLSKSSKRRSNERETKSSVLRSKLFGDKPDLRGDHDNSSLITAELRECVDTCEQRKDSEECVSSQDRGKLPLTESKSTIISHDCLISHPVILGRKKSFVVDWEIQKNPEKKPDNAKATQANRKKLKIGRVDALANVTFDDDLDFKPRKRSKVSEANV